MLELLEPLLVLAEPGVWSAQDVVMLPLATSLGLILSALAFAGAGRRGDASLALGLALLACATAVPMARMLSPGLRGGTSIGLALRDALPPALVTLLGVGLAAWLVRGRREAHGLVAIGIGALVAAYAIALLVADLRAERALLAPVPHAGVPVVRADMVFVPAGPFLRGSLDPEQRAPIVGSPIGDEIPVRTVWLDEFWIDRTEVTNAAFRTFVEATGYVTEIERTGNANAWLPSGWTRVEGASWRRPTGPGSDLGGRDRHPVVQVGHADAAAFCRWAGKRLPSEAEWEKAARGSDGRDYPWGADFDPARLNYCDRRCPTPARFHDPGHSDGFAHTAPVGSFPTGASPYGALDMAGNVWEWVEDRYHPDYYSFASPVNPAGPHFWRASRNHPDGRRVVRGGSFTSEPGYARTTSRSFDPPSHGYFGVGFRCARSASEAPSVDVAERS